MKDKRINAEDVAYWKSSTTSPDTWIDRAKKIIVQAGGIVLADGFGQDNEGRAAYMLAFSFGDERFKIVWPVLPSKSGNGKAARIQAATCLYHDVKARAVSAKVLGFRAAYLTYWLLPDGRTASEAASPELMEAMPKLLMAAINNS